jgi:hypothetical protein
MQDPIPGDTPGNGRSTHPGQASHRLKIELARKLGLGDHAAARDALDRTHTAFDQPAGHPAPASFHNHATAHLTATTGHVLLRADDHSSARETLTAALDQLDPTARRQRVLVLVDLATAELHSSNLPAACSRATQAADLLHQASYATGAARLRAFRDAAARPIGPRALRVLDEHLGHLAA